MKRPCYCDRVQISTVWSKDQCVRCWHWFHTPRFRAQWGGNPADCVAPPIREESTVRHERVVVPQPPSLIVTATNKRALVTVVVGSEATKCFRSSGAAMSQYAKRIGVDFIVMDWPGHPRWPISSKFAIGRVLDKYERIAFVDSDVLLRPTCPDLFDMCSAEEFGAFDELPWRTPFLQQEYLRFRRDFGHEQISLPWYINTGVMVASQQHSRWLLPPVTELPTYHCAEQDYINAVLLDDWRKGLVKVALLPQICNWQNWMDPGFKNAPPDAILHWSGSARRCERPGQIAKWARAAGIKVG